MKTIKFSDQELEFISQMYNEELAEAKKYVDQIQDLLKKLGAKPAKEEPAEKAPKQAVKRGRKPSIKKAEPKEPKKRGRKPGVVVPKVEPIAVAATLPVKEEKKKAEPKNKVAPKAKVKAAKKPVAKPAPKKKVEKPKAGASVGTVVASLLATAPKKEVKKVVKKKAAPKKSAKLVAASPRTGKPVTKKQPEAGPAPMVEPMKESKE
jgi:hypothetical protein